jgi:hypothetical protein
VFTTVYIWFLPVNRRLASTREVTASNCPRNFALQFSIRSSPSSPTGNPQSTGFYAQFRPMALRFVRFALQLLPRRKSHNTRPAFPEMPKYIMCVTLRLYSRLYIEPDLARFSVCSFLCYFCVRTKWDRTTRFSPLLSIFRQNCRSPQHRIKGFFVTSDPR